MTPNEALERHNQEILEERRIMELSKKRKKMAGYYAHKKHYDKLIEQKEIYCKVMEIPYEPI